MLHTPEKLNGHIRFKLRDAAEYFAYRVDSALFKFQTHFNINKMHKNFNPNLENIYPHV